MVDTCSAVGNRLSVDSQRSDPFTQRPNSIYSVPSPRWMYSGVARRASESRNKRQRFVSVGETKENVRPGADPDSDECVFYRLRCSDDLFEDNVNTNNDKASDFYKQTIISSVFGKCRLTRNINPINVPILSQTFANSQQKQGKQDESNWKCKPTALSLLVLIVLTSVLTLPHTQAEGQLDLTLGILVAESCSNGFIDRAEGRVQEAISDFYALTDSIEPDFRLLTMSAVTYPYCSTKDIVASLDAIFGNETIHAVLALTSYDIHQSFLPLAELYKQAYFALNVFVPTVVFHQSASILPSFSQRAKMLAKVLDNYRWEHIFVLQTNSKKWDDFTNRFFFEMSSLGFAVSLGDLLVPPLDQAGVVSVLQQVEAKHKGWYSNLVLFFLC
ncbi:hypothetical protein PoB_001569500 [Plakobranchus ocellatus]|uniref:Receptor ligand binding region domain-containing protein n=1 Tax=Plakobranchus ocellatus TaxID=259542 RepID=A0AAV3Z213_9GAST|nr:hypothetical protein PoB_001569500 [Plakobranchus ocellatus]